MADPGYSYTAARVLYINGVRAYSVGQEVPDTVVAAQGWVVPSDVLQNGTPAPTQQTVVVYGAPQDGQTAIWSAAQSRFNVGVVAPSGAAGGDLSGTYPNPTLGPTVDARYTALRSTVYNDPTGKPDAALTALTLDSGQQLFNNSGNSTATQTGGVWTHPNTQAVGTANASYPQLQLLSGQRVRRFGLEVKFPVSTTGLPALALVVPGVKYWDYNAVPQTQSLAGVHMSINGNGLWTCSVFQNGNDASTRVDAQIVFDTATAVTLQVVNGSGTQTTASLTDLSISGIQTALQALSNVGAGNATVFANSDSSYSVRFSATGWTLNMTASTGGTALTKVINYATGLTSYATSNLPDMRDGKWYKFEFVIDTVASTLTCLWPDGSSSILTNPAIAAYTSRWLIYELFEANTSNVDAPASFRKIWCDSTATPLDNGQASKADIVKTVKSSKRVITEFTAPGTYNSQPIPSGCVGGRVRLFSGGGGGGGGGRQVAGTAAGGGASGGTGGVLEAWLPPALCTGSTYSITIPAAATGGAGATVDGTSGAAGGNAGAVVFATNPATGASVYVRATGGGGGTGGSTVGGVAGAGAAVPLSTAGITGGVAAAGGNGTITYQGGPGGSGAGGGVSAANAATAGGNGGYAYVFGTNAGTAGGVVGGANPVAGAVAQSGRPGDGVGGGAGNAAGAGQNGADATQYGAAGGGGGGAQGGNGGRGGNGGPAYAVVEWYTI